MHRSRPATVVLQVGSHSTDCRVSEWTQHRVRIQPKADRRLWAPLLAPGAEVELGWSRVDGWMVGPSRVVRWTTAYEVEVQPPWFRAGRQRRESPRVPCGWPVEVTSFGAPAPEVFAGTGMDLSATGMAVRARGPFAPGDVVAAAIRTPGDLVVVAVALVVGYDVGAGALRLRFRSLPAADQRWLHRLLDLLTRGAS